MRYISFFLIFSVSSFIISGCDKSSPIKKTDHDHSLYEVIEHSAIHMQDESAYHVSATAAMPGPHLDKDSIEHRRIEVTLPAMENGFGGYIHFGPDITGDMIVCANIETPISITNRSAQGDTPIEIERTFTAQEIVDSAQTSLVKTAVLFGAQTGGNIIKLGPVSQSTISLVIEEAEHDHED